MGEEAIKPISEQTRFTKNFFTAHAGGMAEANPAASKKIIMHRQPHPIAVFPYTLLRFWSYLQNKYFNCISSRNGFWMSRRHKRLIRPTHHHRCVSVVEPSETTWPHKAMIARILSIEYLVESCGTKTWGLSWWSGIIPIQIFGWQSQRQESIKSYFNPEGKQLTWKNLPTLLPHVLKRNWNGGGAGGSGGRLMEGAYFKLLSPKITSHHPKFPLSLA